MVRFRTLAFAALALGAFALAGKAAELPSTPKKAKPPEGAKKCDIGGMPGVLAANGVCVRLSGYVSAAVGGGNVK